MDNKVLATESFSHGNMTYFFDLRQTVNNSMYVSIVRSDKQPDETYERQKVVFFEEDFAFMASALRELFVAAEVQMKAKEKVVSVGVPGGIKGWDMSQRPRERMIGQGASALSDAELLAILIGSGSPRESAVGLAARILAGAEYSLQRLSRSTFKDLCAFKGMGHAKSATILAAMELAKRYQEELVLLYKP